MPSPEILEFRTEHNHSVVVKMSAEDRVSSDAGSLLMRGVLDKIGVVQFVVEWVTDTHNPKRVKHSTAHLLRQLLLQMMQGWEHLRDSDQLRKFLSGLKKAGYPDPESASVPLKQYGVPQGRRRFLLLACRHWRVKFPPETHGPGTDNPEFATVRDWIGHLPPIRAGETHPEVPNHRPIVSSQFAAHPTDSRRRRTQPLAEEPAA